MLSLISTSPLHSEINYSPISLDLAGMLKDQIFLESDEDSYPEWEDSSSKTEEKVSDDEGKISENIEEKDEILKAYEENRLESREDAPSPCSFSSEESVDERSYQNPTNLLQEFFASLCEKARENSPAGFVLPWPYSLSAEREILHKVLMMLLGFNSDFFQWQHQEFLMVQQVEVSHLTPSCLHNTLQFFIKLATLLNSISLKSEQLKNDECLTYQYFGQACEGIVKEFRKKIIFLQEELAVQSGMTSRKSLKQFPQSIISLISLQNKLVPMFDHVRILQGAIEKLVSEKVLKTSSILNYLYSLIQNNYALTDYPAFSMVVRVFLTTIKPFIEELSVWLSQGTVEHLDEGFIIEKSEGKSTIADTWEKAFRVRVYEGVTVVPIFLRAIEKEILITGKNMMLIRKIEDTILDRVLPPPSPLLLDLENLMYQELLHHASHFFNRVNAEVHTSITPVIWNFNVFQPLSLEKIAKFKNFQLETKDIPSHLLVPSHYVIPDYQRKTTENLEKYEEISTWISFQFVLDNTISSTVKRLYRDTCQYLLEILREKFNLNSCFTSLREVLLMENGESVRPLLRYINKNSDLKEFFDNTYELQNLFSEGIKSIKNKKLIPHFSCNLTEINLLKTKSLENITIQFSPPTPLDICFDESSLKTYQKLFTRILQIKRAVHCAKSLKWRSQEKANSTQTQKKFLIFQKKLIHFAICYEEYIMQNVLHTSANVFMADEAKVKSIDDLRLAHQKYLNQAMDNCLLSEKALPLNNAVSAVFRCCGQFFKLMKGSDLRKKAGEVIKDMEKFEEIQQNFDNANRFLLQVLSKSLQNRRNMQCKWYLDIGSYFSMNFNRFYIYD